jgi:lipoprotein-releasing system ATP-binding protein
MSSGGIHIQADNVTMTYRSGPAPLTVLENLSVAIQPGERVAIVGESGAGKSTFLYLLGGLDRPTAGAVRYDGRNILELAEPELAAFRNESLGFVWQMNSLLPEFSALENVAMPLYARGVAREQAAQAASERLAEVGLAGRAHHRPGALSGGEQQRVAFARALVANPRALLADEPTGNLDFRTGETIARLLDELHARHGFTAVVVTHNLAFARRFDRILQLREGVFVPFEE